MVKIQFKINNRLVTVDTPACCNNIIEEDSSDSEPEDDVIIRSPNTIIDKFNVNNRNTILYFEWKYENICIIPFRRSSIVMIAEMIRKMCLEEYSVRKSTLISDSEKESTYQRLTSPELKMQITSFMRSYLATQDNINNDESIFAKSIVNRQINLHEQKVQIKKIFKFMSGTDSKLADNLIFTDEEVSKTRNIPQLRKIKGLQ